MQPWSKVKYSLLEGDNLATAEENAIAAINAAEAMALSNVQLIRQLKKIIPDPLGILVEPGIQVQTGLVRAEAKLAKKAVRKTSAAARKSRKNLSIALREANARLRKKNGQLKKGKTQSDVMKLAQRLKKKM